MLYVHKLRYHSALKRKKILPHATAWINFEDILLSERNQSQKDRCFMVPLRCIPKVAKYIETECKTVIVRGGENGKVLFNKHRGSV